MPAVGRIDHVNIVTDAPRALADAISAGLDLPFSSPLVELPSFDLAILAAGNVTIEVQRNGWRRRYPDEPTRARLFGLVFHTDDVEETVAGLTRLGIPHIAPLVFGGPANQLRAYDGYRRSAGDPAWRVAVIDGVLSDDLVSTRLSARAVAGSTPAARRMGRIMGRLASARHLGRWTAPLFDPGPRFVGVCEWGHDVTRRRAADRERLAGAQAGGLGISSVREVRIAAAEIEAAQGRWERLLGPPQPGELCWPLGEGPALRLVEGTQDDLTALVFEVDSLESTGRALRARGLLDEDADGDELALAPSAFRGLDLRFVAAA